MDIQTKDHQSGNFDVIKYVFSVIFVVSALSAFYYFAQFAVVYRIIGLLVTTILVLLMMSKTSVGRDVLAFVAESKIEVRKIVWPTKDETIRTTLLVFAMVFIVSLILWLLDTFLFLGIRTLTNQGG